MTSKKKSPLSCALTVHTWRALGRYELDYEVYLREGCLLCHARRATPQRTRPHMGVSLLKVLERLWSQRAS